MIEAISCGGVVIFRGKILLLYKNYRNRYEGWVLPKGTVEQGEEYKDTAIREVLEETGATATIIQYVGKSQYSFTIPEDTVEKSVHWYLMMGESYYSKPQREEYFTDSGYYKYHEAYHLLKFSNEKQILEKAYNEYLDLKKVTYGEHISIFRKDNLHEWYEDLYVGDSIEGKVNRIKWKINHHAGTVSIYVIAFASNRQNLLDIIPAWELMQKSYPGKNKCRSSVWQKVMWKLWSWCAVL